MVKAKSAAANKIEPWKLVSDYVETCNCNFGCPCNFSGHPTDGPSVVAVADVVAGDRFEFVVD
jgi:hypothetical protein